MAHHSEEPLPKGFLDSLPEGETTTFERKLGPTGRFPEGKVTETDRGEVKICIGATEGRVFIDFGTSLEWIGFTSQQARDIAAVLEHHAKAAQFQVDNAQGKS